MGCTFCAKLLLIIVNVLFVLIGLAMLVVGCMLRFGEVDVFNEHVMSILKGLGASEDGESVVSFNSLVGTASLALIISGVLIFAIGFLGMAGAACNVRCLLLIYAIIIAVIILTEVIGIILLFTLTESIETFVKTFLKDTLNDQYAGSTSTDVTSMGWNYLFVEFDCCGVENYTDTHLATKWNRTFVRSSGQIATKVTPETCCKVIGTFPDYQAPSTDTCFVEPTNDVSNFNTPCYDALKDKLQSLSGYLIGISVGILLLELLLFSSALAVYLDNGNKVAPVAAK